MTKKPTSAGAIFAFLLAAAVTISGCSSSGGKGSTSSANTPTTSGSGSSAGATGSPILIGGAIPIHSSVYNQPDAETGLDAAVASINAAGGVNGHPLQVDFCDTQYSVNGERRSFSLLRPSNGDATAQDKLRELILQAYAEFEEQAAVTS